MGRFLSNTYDPRRPEVKQYLRLSYHDWLDPQGHDRAWKRHMEWIDAGVIGRPEATDTYTVEQLEAMGMVGIYAKDPPARGGEEADPH